MHICDRERFEWVKCTDNERLTKVYKARQFERINKINVSNGLAKSFKWMNNLFKRIRTDKITKRIGNLFEQMNKMFERIC